MRLFITLYSKDAKIKIEATPTEVNVEPDTAQFTSIIHLPFTYQIHLYLMFSF
jgi:hypothetical protein